MTLITNDPSQIRVHQPVHPIVDTSNAPDVGQAEAQATMDTNTDKGYFGNTPADNDESS